MWNRPLLLSIALSLAIPLSAQAEPGPSVPLPTTPPTLIPFACETNPNICWYVDAQGELQGVANMTEFGMGLILGQGNPPPPSNVDYITLATKRNIYNANRDTLRKRWTTSARLLVSNSIHTNISTIALSVSQIVTEWNDMVKARVQKDIDGRNAVIAGIAMTFAGFSYAIPGGLLVQNAVFQVILRAGLPLILAKSGYSFSELPREFSSAFQGIVIDSLESDIQQATSTLLTQAGLKYLTMTDGEARLKQDTDNQEEQIRVLGAFAGTPVKQKDLSSYLLENRDFRLLYAAKLVTALGPIYEEEINAFIVTGYFAELAWASSGVSTRGVIYDLYVPADPSAFANSGPPGLAGLPLDPRRKRVWDVDGRWRLKPRDCGSYLDGKLAPVRLLLPYWDEAVVPYGEKSPVLKPKTSAAIDY